MTTEEMTLRVNELERRQLWLVRFGLVVLALVTGPLLVGAGKATTDGTIDAQKVVIRDLKGTTRIAIGSAVDGTGTIELFDASGGKVMSLRGSTAAPIIELADGADGSAWLTASATGSSLALSKGNGEVEIAANAAGAPY